MIRAIHTAVQGRARYTVPGLYGSEALKKRLEFRLGACEGIQEVAASTLTGNVLVRFRPHIGVEVIAALLGNVLAEHANALCSRNGVLGDSVSANGARPATPRPVVGRSTRRRAVVPAEAQREVPWHVMEVEAVAASLDTTQDAGLSHVAAQARLKRYGPNLPSEATPRSGLSMLLEQFTSLPVALLGAAAGIALLTGGVADALVIAGVVALNAAIGYVTESQTEQTIHALTNLVRPSTQVLRDGNTSAGTQTVHRTMLTQSGSSLVDLSTASSGLGDDVVRFIRGEDVNKEKSGGDKTRPSIHGDVIHSRPLPVNYGDRYKVRVFYGANDGALHSVDAETGVERWSFIAPEFFGLTRAGARFGPLLSTGP